MAEEDDRRPESSPFAGFTTQVYFREGPEFVVPTSLIQKCPKLISDGTRWPPKSIRLDDVASSTAHVLFYYLLTDTYQCLKPKGSSQHERLGNELKTGVQTYNAARNYELQALQELAKNEIQRIAQELPFPLVLNLLRNLHLDPSERETWIDDYVLSGLKSLFRTPTAFLDLTSLQVEQDEISLSNILLKGLAGLLTSDTPIARVENVATPTLAPEPAAIEEVPIIVEEPALVEEEPVLVERPPREEDLLPSVEPTYIEVSLPEPIEPSPPEQERKVSPEPSLKPAQEEDILEHAIEPVPEPVYEPTPELQLAKLDPVPEPEPEVKTAVETAVPPRSDSPADYAFGNTTWGELKDKSKKDSLWLEDEIIESRPTESPPEIATEPIEPSTQVVPSSSTDFWNIKYSAPVAEPEPIPEATPEAIPEAVPVESPPADVAPAPAKAKSKKKKRMSIFGAAEESPEPETRSIVEEPAPIVKPEPEPEPPKVSEDTAASIASASAPKKKKKKKSIFWTEAKAA
ncbi:hypothetical protein GQX73_g9807 [Xylaria multiplex]|uniref:Uncharacterized protein n=1 Tax=Xylaria multiplex TaxID=323545 RepID=A0A7C8MMG3_9PEZI|nr:hypothetical protein GQX73_g9807 [Xylaria multiplex]